MYCIDASALIDGWVRYYPPDVLPSLWEEIDALITDGSLIAPTEVKLELARGGDDLYDWVEERDSIFTPPTASVQTGVEDIVNDFPLFVPEHAHDGVWADPYLISVARVESATVVTGEKRAGIGARKPKIPNVCDHYGVPCISLLELIRAEGWKF